MVQTFNRHVLRPVLVHCSVRFSKRVQGSLCCCSRPPYLSKSPQKMIVGLPNLNEISSKSHPSSSFSPNYLKLSIWTIGIALLAGLTIMDFVPLLGDYRNKNVATQIAVVKRTPDRPPNITVCLPYYSSALAKIAEHVYYDQKSASTKNETIRAEELEPSSLCPECEAMRRRSWDVRTHANISKLRANTSKEEQLNVYENELATILIRRLLEYDDFSELTKLNRSNFNWNQPILDAIWKFLACMQEKDLRYLNNETQFAKECEGFDFRRLESGTSIVLRNDTLDKFYQVSMEAINTYLKVYARFGETWPTGWERTLKSPLLRRVNLTPMSRSLCLPLLENSTGERFVYTAVQQDDHVPTPWNVEDGAGKFTLWPDDTIIYSLARYFSALYRADMANDDENVIHVFLAYSIQASVSETRTYVHCHHEYASSALCLARKQVGHVIELCKCIPFFYRFIAQSSENTTYEYCTTNAYMMCRTDLKARMNSAMESCSNRCKHTIYSWKRTSVVKKERSRNWSFEVSISPETADPYVEFTLTLRDSPEKFLSQIGGLINLYLGLSGLSAFAFLIACIDYLRKRWGSRRSMGNEVQMNTMENGGGKSSKVEGSSGWQKSMSQVDLRHKRETVEERMEKLESKMDLVVEKLAGMDANSKNSRRA